MSPSSLGSNVGVDGGGDADVGVAEEFLDREEFHPFAPGGSPSLEDSLVIGDARAVERKAGQREELSPKAWKCLGRPSINDRNRFMFDGKMTVGMSKMQYPLIRGLGLRLEVAILAIYLGTFPLRCE